MTLKERLNADFKEAMKNKQTVRKETISFVRAAIKQYEVDNREEIDDAG
ncbi:MAG: GatB/YqeY domain-containing protein, partial [Firmicutes bacterium]|nr:GatB/YqeY domain-containing protein [Bacillota bacterium]